MYACRQTDRQTDLQTDKVKTLTALGHSFVQIDECLLKTDAERIVMKEKTAQC